MKYAIIYSSTTGNTKMLAEALALYMKKTDCVLCETKHADAIDADFYFVGFWTFRGKCDKNTQQFLKKLEHKYIFLFGTAGFGSSNAYYKKILRRTRKHLHASTKLAGSFMCQGKMPPQIRKKYESMLHPIVARKYANYMIRNYDRAFNHPNQQDLDELYSELLNVLSGLNSCEPIADCEVKN